MSAPHPATMFRAEHPTKPYKDYDPCFDGIHVCGIDEERDVFTTEAVFPRRTRADFERAKAECEKTADEPQELVVDLFEGGDVVEDFAMTRQMLGRLAAMLRSEAA